MIKNTLKRPKGLKKPAVRIGKGGKRGKTSGKGMKGQKARTGNSTRPEMRDIIKKLPKRRGYGVNRSRTVVHTAGFQSLNLNQLEMHFDSGATVSPKIALKMGLARRAGGKLPKVKILGRGELSKKLIFEGVTVSETARLAIEKAGGTIK